MRPAALLLFALSAPGMPTGADTTLRQVFAYVDAFIAEHRRAEGTPGIAVALVNRDTLLHLSLAGVADLGTREALTPSTRFLAGSISKVVTAIALLQLQEEGVVALDRPVTTYLPWFRVRSSYPPITLQHLLSHTAGLPRDRSDLPSSPYTAVALRDREVGGPPGEWFAYSNIGYQLLSLVIEEVEGRPFAEVVSARVLRPLGMTESAPAVTQEGRRGAATGYQYFFDDRPPLPGLPLVPVPWSEYTAGDANLVSTPTDLARLLQALLRQGAGPQGRLLQPASFSRMVRRTVRAPELGANAFYGDGLVLDTLAGDPVFWHSGGMPGYRAMIIGDQDEGLGVVVMLNGPGNPRRVAEYALEALVRARRGQAMLPVPIAADPAIIAEASRYAGVYRDTSGGQLTLVAAGNRLSLAGTGPAVSVVRLGPEEFFADDPAVAPFPIRFRFLSDGVAELLNGGRWFRRPGPALPGTAPPAPWLAYPGHYRAQLPYYSNYRVVIRQGVLLLLTPEGYEEVLVSLGHGEFRVGQDVRSPERLRFGEIVSGRALRLNLSGTEYYRTTTP